MKGSRVRTSKKEPIMIARARTSLIGPVLSLGLVAAASEARATTGTKEPENKMPSITCEVEGQTAIVSIILDGLKVEEGQLVCELDSGPLKERLVKERIIVQAAEEACREARKRREVAEIAAAEYANAIVKQDLAAAQGEIKLAESDLTRSEDRVDWARRMEAKGFVAKAQRVSEELTLQKAKFALEQAQTKLKVLEGYTRPKTVKELASEIEKARSDERATNRFLQLEKAKLAHLQEQIDRCRMFAPVAGTVVHVRRKADPEGGPDLLPRTGIKVRKGEVLARIVPSQETGARPASLPSLQPTGGVGAGAMVVRSRIGGETTVLSILPAGTQVKKGQVVCELDSADLKDEVAGQKLATAQAEIDLQTRKSVLEIAELSLKEYQEGIYLEERAALQGETKIAEAELALAQKQVDLARQNPEKDALGLHQKDIALLRSKLQLERAQSRLQVLEQYTHPKQARTLEMGVGHARDAVRLATERLEVERTKTERLERLVSLCRITAPQDGKVGLTSTWVGQTVKEGQHLLEIEPVVESQRQRPR
jgi:multidrug resistance efflux pump